jgi:hypothetical protein
MVLRRGMAGVTGITPGHGGLPGFLIARSGPSRDNPQMRAGGCGPAVTVRLAEPGGELGRWS